MLKTGNFSYRNWALLQIADLRNVFAQGSKPLLHYPSGTMPIVCQNGENICVVRHINTLWKSGSRIRSGFLCKNLIHPFGKCWLNCLWISCVL